MGARSHNVLVTMLIKVKTLTGKEIEIDIEPTDKVERIKERVEEKEGIPPPQQRLIFSGKQMNDEKTAADLFSIWCWLLEEDPMNNEPLIKRIDSFRTFFAEKNSFIYCLFVFGLMSVLPLICTSCVSLHLDLSGVAVFPDLLTD